MCEGRTIRTAIIQFAAISVVRCVFAAPVEPPKNGFEPKTPVEKAAMAAMSRYSEKEIREIMGFFAPVVKKWKAAGEQFAKEYMVAEDKSAVLRRYLPKARAVIEDARRMRLPRKCEDRREQYVSTAEALYAVVSFYLRIDSKLK